SPDPQPNKLPVVVASIEQLIGSLCGDNLCVVTVLADQKIGRAPNVEFGDHAGFPPRFKRKRRTDAGVRGLSTISGRPVSGFGNGSSPSIEARSRRNSSMRERM